TIRKEGGLSGFTNREESDCDTFTTGHSSTSISSALGLATANSINHKNDYTVAIIGDGALTGGLAFEAINNIGRKKKNLIVILNDNNMSISKNVGSLARHLNILRLSFSYIEVKNSVEFLLKKIPLVGNALAIFLRKLKTLIKRIFYNTSIFECMGVQYYGPYDGHNIELLTKVLNKAKKINKPVLIHVKTTKGKGYEYAEDKPKDFHGVSSFDPNTGKGELSRNSFSSVFGNCITNLATNNDKICAITAAMSSGTGLNLFAKTHKERFFDVGIAEAHAVTFSAGLSRKGMIPIFAVYSTFLSRAYSSLIHDVSLQNLKVILAIDRAGLVGDDGKTHQGVFDVSFLKTVPNARVYSPSYFDELDFTLQKLVESDCELCAVRYPRGHEGYKPKEFVFSDKDYDVFGDKNAKVSVVTYGREFSVVATAVKKIDFPVKIIKLNRIIPIPCKAIEEVISSEKLLIAEEASCGIASDFVSKAYEIGFKGKFVINDIKNAFVSHASFEKQLEQCELDEESIINTIKNL
ncbi:MAG: 1-deoxy-D-xylulose-5-phosphate synthase, partial [Clostridia bacterium]